MTVWLDWYFSNLQAKAFSRFGMLITCAVSNHQIKYVLGWTIEPTF